MTLTSDFRKEMRRMHRLIGLYLVKIEQLRSAHIEEGMSAQEREAAERQAFPDVKAYAIAQGTDIMERADQIAAAVRVIPDMLAAQAKKEKLSQERVALVEQYAKKAVKKLHDFFKSVSMFLYGVIGNFKTGVYPAPALDTLRLFMVLTPTLLESRIEAYTTDLEDAELYISAPVHTEA